MELDEEFYTTRDLTMAATLVCLHFPLEGYEVQYEGIRPKPRFYFKFTQSVGLDKAINKILNKDTAVEPYTFWGNIRMLKSLMDNDKNRPDRAEMV
jgi:hypothetical protein